MPVYLKTDSCVKHIKSVLSSLALTKEFYPDISMMNLLDVFDKRLMGIVKMEDKRMQLLYKQNKNTFNENHTEEFFDDETVLALYQYLLENIIVFIELYDDALSNNKLHFTDIHINKVFAWLQNAQRGVH